MRRSCGGADANLAPPTAHCPPFRPRRGRNRQSTGTRARPRGPLCPQTLRQSIWVSGTLIVGGGTLVNDQRNRAVVAEIFSQLDRMTEARRSRLIAAEGAVPNVI